MKYLVEIGGGTILHSWDFYQNGDRLRVFEPHPKNIEYLKKTYPNIEILPYAIWHKNETLLLNDLGDTSFIADIVSPAVANNDYQGKATIPVEGRTFDQFDDGSITHLWIDTEGSEWHVLQRLKSRPSIISIEMAHVHYKNPHYDNIVEWMKSNNYVFQKEDAGSYFYELRK